MRAYFKFVLRHRILVMALIALLSAGGVWSILDAKISSSLGKLFLANSPAYEQYLERVAEFGSDEQLIIAFEEEDLLSPDSLRRLLRVTTVTEAFPQIARVRSLLDNEAVFPKGGVGGIEARIEELAGSREKTASARAELLNDRFTEGILVSPDFRHGAGQDGPCSIGG